MLDDLAVLECEFGIDFVVHNSAALAEGVRGFPVSATGGAVRADAVERDDKVASRVTQHVPHRVGPLAT